MTLDQIHDAIPHRPPFLLVDEILERDERRILCRKRFTGDEFWYAGHYPGFPVTPGVLLCEAGMQAGAILLAPFIQAAKGRLPVAARINDVRFKKMVLPGDEIVMEVTLDDHLGEAFFLTAKVTNDGKLACRFEFVCMMAEPQSGASGSEASGAGP